MKLSDEKQTFDGKFRLVNSYDRLDIMTPDTNTGVADELNTYRNWGAFGMRSEPYREPADGENYEDLMWAGTPKTGHYIGTKSIFNNVNAVGFNLNYQVINNAPLLDTQEMRERIRQRGDCSIKELVRASGAGEMGRAIYNYSDFMYCKYLGRISNNYLVTLRRFPFPAGDHINYMFKNDPNEKEVQQHMPDVGRLVTWIGTPGNEMSGILKYKVLMPYVEQNAQIHEIQGTAESGGLMGSILNIGSNSYAGQAMAGITGQHSIKVLQNTARSIGKIGTGKSGKGGSFNLDFLTDPPANEWAYHRDETKPYGPVDVITSTHRRADGGEGGLKFEQDITLTFDYELRSFDGINTKAAFLDLLSNILSVTYTNGKFWGGTYRQTGPSQANIFANLPIYNLKQPVSFNNVVGSVFDTLGMVTQRFNNNQPISSFKDIANAAKNLLNNAASILIGGALNALGRPQKQALNSLLNEAPTGLWHLTVGNPKHPIMSMGNMILSDVQIEHYGPLGLDDFPTGLKVTIQLKHGKPRDQGQIEQMYMMGDYRIYNPMGKFIQDMYDGAADYKKDMDVNNTSNTVVESERSKPTATPSDNMGAVHNEVNDRYMKYFGTDTKQNIIWAGMEGHLGSNPAKTAEQASAEQEKFAKEKEKSGM